MTEYKLFIDDDLPGDSATLDLLRQSNVESIIIPTSGWRNAILKYDIKGQTYTITGNSEISEFIRNNLLEKRVA